MSNIGGKGKQRRHVQDLNSNAMQMGGGQVAMPPNGGASTNVFVTPVVANQAGHMDYNRPYIGGVDIHTQPPVSGSQGVPTMVLPKGFTVSTQEPPSQYAMGGVPVNMHNAGQGNTNIQWNGPPQSQMMNSGMGPRGAPQQGRLYSQQPVGFYPPTPYVYMPQQNMYAQPYQTQEQAAYAAAYAQQQQQQQYMQYSQPQMIPQHMQQHQSMAPMQMQAQPTLQQGGGAAAGGPTMSGMPPNQQSMAGQVPPVSGTQSMHQGSALVNVATGGPTASFNPAQQQTQQPRPAPLPRRERNVLAIVDPTTKDTINQAAVEASKKEEDEEPNKDVEKEEAKGTDEMDSAAPEVKKQFAAQILEQSTKTDQPVPAPTSAPAPKQNKCLFSLDQVHQLGLSDKISHVPTAPVVAPVAAAPASEEKPVVKAAASEYLPEPLLEPAYPTNYKENQAKQTSPDVTLSEMPAANNDEHPDYSTHMTPETTPPDEPASSSSEKNTSNDSAICVQTPFTSPTNDSPTTVVKEEDVAVEEPAAAPAAADDVVVEEEKEVEQEKEAEELPTKQLEQLVIADPASQDEAESEPSTPAPVTPSVSETTATLAEEEEDAEKAAAAAEEERQRKRAELEAAIALNEQDLDQVNEEISRYNREYLYNVRDIEKMFSITECPLTPQQLKDFGICRSQVSNDQKRGGGRQDGQGGFMPSWGQRQGGAGGQRSDRKPYQGRQSEQHHRGGGGGGRGSNKKLPPSIRPSIERRVDTNVQLHKAEKAWKVEKVSETDLESEEVKKKLLLKNIRSLFNKITPTTKDQLINEFLDYKVYQSPSLSDVISIIFDKAVEEPKFCPLYSSMCITQVGEELKENNNVSEFRNAILARAQDTFTTKTLDDFIKEKEAEIDAEADEKKKKEKQIELLEAKSKFRRRKFGNITFIGQLYLHGLISVRIITFCVVDLLKSVTEKPADITGYEADEESVDCAVRLLETIGKRLHENNVTEQRNAAAAAAVKAGPPKTIQRHAPPPKQQPPSQQFPLDLAFQTLDTATSIVSSRIKFMIMNLVELRKNGWVPRKTADAGPKKLDEIKNDIKKEQLENAHQQQQYERKQSRQEAMGGGRGPMGGHGGNPKRQIMQRNSSDRGTVEERRSQAVKSSTLATRGAPLKKTSLSSAVGGSSDRSSLGGRDKNKWSGGASGGSENSKKEDRAALIQSTNRFLGNQRSSSSASMKAEDEGANASGNATQVNSEDEREQNAAREKQEAEITRRITCEVGDYASGEITVMEAHEGVFKIVGDEKYSKPSVQLVFKCFMAAAIKKASSTKDGLETMAAKFGNTLAYCLFKKQEEKDNKGREEMLKGIADCCREIVDQEQWEDAPKIWDIVAEVLINAHLPEEGLFEGLHPTLVDFKDTFLNAAKDGRKPYILFILVLKRLVEMHHKRDSDSYAEVVSWVLDECEKITKHMDKVKLDKALTDTEMSWGKNLHEIMRHQ